ncbi:MAG: ATP-binding protein [Candidatus Microthrix sp.]|nr:DUF4143 domain-containing protein [Candidatus Microthrix sp.]MBK7320886.1 ATP-binding protein [Candidatus Microthrix sp.]
MDIELYLPRIVDGPLSSLIQAVPVVLVDGARASGKTTSASRLANSTLRLPQDLALLQSDPLQVLTSMKRPVLIDEWQLAGIEVLWTIKQIVDADPTPGSFILTGSVEPESYGSTYPLTGRSARVLLRPMNRREKLGAGNEVGWLDRLASGEIFTTNPNGDRAELDLLVESGFPGAAPKHDPREWLRAYASTVAERSVAERRDPERVGRLLRVLSELESQAVPDETVWRAADINRETLYSYRDMLTRTHVVTPLPAWETNRLKRITSYPKRQLVDTALALALAGIDANELASNPTLAGRYVESFVVAQLRPEVDAAGGYLSHLRTRGGDQEVDIVIDIGGQLIAIDVKAGVNPTPRDARHLSWFRDRIDARIDASVVLHRGEATFELVDGVWAVPISSLWSTS